MALKNLDAVAVAGKTVLLRVDMNQPVDRATGTLKDTTRIKAALPTMKELSEKGAKVVLLAHQGSDIEYGNFYTTAPHAKVLTELLGKEVKFVEDVCGAIAQEAIKSMKDGDILLLDNVRFESEEQTLFERHLKLSQPDMAKTRVVTKLAPLADLFVNDAFAASHRDQPTLSGFPYVLPSYMGRLFAMEYGVIHSLMEDPARPSLYLLGGAKIADAFAMIDTVLKSGGADTILTGGLVGSIFLMAMGIKLGDPSEGFIAAKGFLPFVETAKRVLADYPGRVIAPVDMAYVDSDIRYELDVDKLDLTRSYLDIGAKSVALYADHIAKAGTVFVNGPLGVFEETLTELGTKEVWKALATTSAYTVIGGGDSITACNKYEVTDQMNFICTGGGALIRMLTGEELPSVKALRLGK